VYASAGQQYDLRINGHRVAHGPSFSYPDQQYYETTDVTKYVRAGASNVVAAITHWSRAGQGRPRSVPAFIAHIAIDHADGTRDVVTTDGTWRAHVGPWLQGPYRNGEGDFVEHLDGRAVPVGWDRPGFDDVSWPRVEVLGAHPTAPFTHLVAARTHIVEQRVAPVSLQHLDDGSFVADFGRVVAATPVLQLHRGVDGRAVTLTAGYLLDPDGRVSTTRSVQETDLHWDYTERAGAQEVRPFGYLAFRYLQVSGAQETLRAADISIAARHAAMPDEHAATFRSSDPRVDAVWQLARHSALYDSQEQFLDTPTREKGQFLLDAFDVSQATMVAFGERALTWQALRDFAASQRRYWPDGRVNAVYPNGDGKRDIPDFTEVYVEWVWRAWLTTGDREQLAALYPVTKRISDYIAAAIDGSTGLVTNLPGGSDEYEHGIVDWPPNMRYGYDMATVARTTVNVLAAELFTRVAQMGETLHRPRAEVDVERARAGSVTAAIRARLDRGDGVLVDGLEADGSKSPHASQQANAYALAYDIVPAARVRTVASYVADLGNATGVDIFANLLDGLHRAGRDDALVAAITDPDRPGYAQILRKGATFTWESWDARETGDSESHGWGAAVLSVLQRDLLGVTVAQPGAAAIDVRPPNGGITSASGTVPTQRGPVKVSWHRTGTRFDLSLTVPANVFATVHVPATRVDHVLAGGTEVGRIDGVVAARASDGEVVLTLGGGRYTLRVGTPAHRGGHSTRYVAAGVTVAFVLVLALAVVGAIRYRRAVRAPTSSSR
jgi:alpha-L-rhamnosidase